MFALIMVWRTPLPVYFKLLSFIVLCLNTIYLYFYAYPAPQVKQLAFICDHWMLEDKQGRHFRFEQHRIVIDLGLFFLLQLRGKKKKTMLIFSDQLNASTYRVLKILERVRG